MDYFRLPISEAELGLAIADVNQNWNPIGNR
jgi:hypothetical protein